MFPELVNKLNEIDQIREPTGEFLRKLNGSRTALRNHLEKAKTSINEKEAERAYFVDTIAKLQKESLKMAKSTVKFNLLNAILSNDEFDEPPYRNSINRAIAKDNAYTFVKTGDGVETFLKIKIDLNRTAGHLPSWAKGIKAYRKILDDEKKRKREEKKKKSGKKRMKAIVYNPLSASRAWAHIYNSREGSQTKFQVTVRNRLELSGALAPFWSIIDKGEPLAMSSNRGGYATPVPVETGFVHDSEKTVNDYIDRQLIAKRKEYQDLLASYREFIKKGYEKLAELDAMAEEIRFDLKVVRKMERELGLVDKDISRTKFEKAVQLVREGLKTTGRFTISGSGGGRVTVAAKAIKELL